MSLDEDLRVMRERLAKASPGPWRLKGTFVCSEGGAKLFDDIGGDYELTPDATFIAAARTDMGVLLEMVNTLYQLFPFDGDEHDEVDERRAEFERLWSEARRKAGAP